MLDRDKPQEWRCKTKQRKWTAEEKLTIVLEGLKEKKSVADVWRE